MKTTFQLGISVLCTVFICGPALAQAPTESYPPADPGTASVPARPDAGPVILEWVPPAMAQLSSVAVAKESFTLDRTMLEAAAGLLPDSDADVRQAAAKLDGLSVHVLRFAVPGTASPEAIDSIREAYHLRGWKHLISTASSSGPVHDQTSDVWLVLDGANVRGAVVLVESPKSLTLVTIAGNLSPVDLLHLRGHFGIPRFGGDVLGESEHN